MTPILLNIIKIFTSPMFSLTRSLKKQQKHNCAITGVAVSLRRTIISTETEACILDIISEDVIPLILSNLTNRQRCQIAHTCKAFNNASKIIPNNSITIKWDHKYNITNLTTNNKIPKS